MTTSRGTNPDDSFWRRPVEPPDAEVAPSAPAPQPDPGPRAYPGPPPNVAPPAHWHPPFHVQLPPPARLPGQDLSGIDESERSARTLTYGVGLIAGAVLVVVMCLLCSRVLF